MIHISDYEPIVGKQVIDELRFLAEKLAHRKVQHVNSTLVGGGVAEILNRLVPLLNELGVETSWDVIEGNDDFFKVTKKFHNALHGKDESLTKEDFNIYKETGYANNKKFALTGDILMIHDPQPLLLIERRDKHPGNWIWRCHVDVSQPNPSVWKFLSPWVEQYDGTIFSAPHFSQKLGVPQYLLSPSIDPLSEKNRELSQDEINSVVTRLEIPQDKPILTQVSRFDYLKDPVGVIGTYRQVKKSIDCRLVLAGGTATDDPESEEVLTKVKEAAANDPDIHILCLPPNSNLEINALQRISSVVIQKSIREGFGLTVSEALWKGKPVVASAVGGIPLQIKHRYSGLLCHSIEGAAYFVKQILNDPAYGKRLGDNAREHVRQNFLLTRHLKKYMLLFLIESKHNDIIHINSH